MTLKIVTDSTTDVPPELLEKYDITVIPLYVVIDGKSYAEGVDITRRNFYQNLASYNPYPTTAAPPAGIFAETYQKLADEGATEILSIHLANSLSNTYNAARLGAESVTGANVTLFDTQQITVGAGLQVIAAAEAASAGQSVSEIVTMLTARAPRTRVFGMLDSLESLRRSGRVNWATFGFGTLLQIKPLMMIHDGDISVIAKVRTRKRALKQLLQIVESFAPFERMAVIHINAPEAAAELHELASHLFPPDKARRTMEVTATIGTHLGLGAVGFACMSKKD